MDHGPAYWKIKYYVQKFLPPRRLKHVEVETTSYCNRKCVYCPNFTVGRPEERIKDEVFIRIIDSLARMGFQGRFSPHFYGEPLTDPRLEQFMKYAHGKLPSADLIVYTNGDFLSVEKFLALKAAGVKKFRVSLHSPRPGKELAETLNYVAERPEYASDIETVPYFGEYASGSAGRLNNRGGAVEVKRKKSLACQYVNQLTVDYLGNTVLCCNDYNATVSFGNVMDREIADIWNDPAYVKARLMISHGIFPYPVCRVCNI